MTLQRIGVSSAFRVGVVIYGLMFLIFGGISLLCNLALIVPFSRAGFMIDGELVNSGLMGGAGVAGLGILCIIYVAGAAATALFGGLSLAMMALFYNLAVRWVGGVELEIAAPGGQSAANSILSEMSGRTR